MSAKFSTSPSLRLRIAESQTCFRLQLAMFVAGLCAVTVIALEGRPQLASLLFMVLFCSLPRLMGQPAVGQVISWRQGHWLLDRGSGDEPVKLAAASVATPLAIHFCWQAGREHGRLWLFQDSGDAAELRKLRVRLGLER